MIEQGADWIDIGGESTRPGASSVSIEEEINRVIPVIKQLREINDKVMISIDTRNHQVARLALVKRIWSMMSGLRDKQMIDLVIEARCAACIMHMNGEPGNMQKNLHTAMWLRSCDLLGSTGLRLIDRGLPKELILIDPGIGFGKTQQHNILLMKSAKRFQKLGYGLWGVFKEICYRPHNWERERI